MKKNILIITLLSTLQLYALETQTVHSSISTYYELRDFSNSVQKYDGSLYGIGADIHYKDSEFRLAYEKGDARTKQPPLTEDLKNEKLYLRYGHVINDTFSLNANYINVLHDNMVPTDKSIAYGLGTTYRLNKAIEANFTQYYVDYQIFETHQSDLSVHYKAKYKELKYKLSFLAKYINLDHKENSIFSKNAQDDYTTAGIKFHSHYKTYHFGFGAFFGNRVFAIMNDGFKIQHHAMEFDRTYALGIGKTFGDFILRYQYIYQRAEELPMQNENVDVSNNRFILNYKF